MDRKIKVCELKTPFEEGCVSWSEVYPRPQLRRELWLSLCGSWQLSVSDGSHERPLGSIEVPFPPQSRLSGIGADHDKGETLVYRRTFSLPKEFFGKRIVLHVGAADQRARVYVNGRPAAQHVGGYLPFDADLTDIVTLGDNSIRIEVDDPLDTDLGYGKQRKKRGGMWYTPISGLWQSVWLEAMPKVHVERLRLTPSLSSVVIETVGGEPEKRLILDSGEEYLYSGDRFILELSQPVCWTPETPKLYGFTLLCGEDRVDSYFALRTVGVEKKNGKPCLCLNGKPYFFHGLLDQGYFSDGIYTPASPEGYEHDVLAAKKLGFNMLRKHIKIEPELFYYYCDLHGMAVFQDMVNSGRYSFLLDTALPTVGIKRGLARPAGRYRREQFEKAAGETLELLYNHPSVCCYTVFNEGWGQYIGGDRLYFRLKAADPTRIYDTASGWFRTKRSDVVSEHVYFRKASVRTDTDRPVLLSEFGGYSCIPEGHCYDPKKSYGYRQFKTFEELSGAVAGLYRREILPLIEKGLCGAVLTQLSDVEDETNGLLSYDRRVVKIPSEVMLGIAGEIYSAFERVWEY